MKTLLITQISKDPMVLAKKLVTIQPFFVFLIVFENENRNVLEKSYRTLQYFNTEYHELTIPSPDDNIGDSLNMLVEQLESEMKKLVSADSTERVVYDVTTGMSILNVLNNDSVMRLAKNNNIVFATTYIQRNTEELLIAEMTKEGFDLTIDPIVFSIDDDLSFRKTIFKIDNTKGVKIFDGSVFYTHSESYEKLYYKMKASDKVRRLFNSYLDLYKEERKHRKRITHREFKIEQLKRVLSNRRGGLEKTVGDDVFNGKDFGLGFERIILAGLTSFLKKNPTILDGISSIYSGVILQENGAIIAEYDIVIFMKNGMTNIIELKSSRISTTKKDLISRINVAKNHLGNDLRWFTVFPLTHNDFDMLRNVTPTQKLPFVVNASSWRDKINAWQNQRSDIQIIALDEFNKIFEK